ARARAGRVWRVVVRARISFLTRLVMLKLMAFFTFIFMALYTPSTTNSLLDGAGGVSTLVAKGADNLLQYLSGQIGDVSYLVPRKGVVELAFRLVAMDKVMLFIGIAITLYLGWMLLITAGRGVKRRIDDIGTPRADDRVRVQTGPPH